MPIPLSHRLIAMTDLETTGDMFTKHEILEIGLVLFDQQTFEIVDTLSIKIKPEHVEDAVPATLALNGYTPELWKDAISLEEGIRQYAEKTKDAIFCAFNATFDWGFMNAAFAKTDIKDLMDYHHLDLLSIAWERGVKHEQSWSLKNTCTLFSIPPEPPVHTALNGALTAYELFKKLAPQK